MAGENNPVQFGDGGNGSTINTANTPQLSAFLFEKKALVEASRDAIFLPLASVKDMPANHGKKIKQYVMIPLLDDANLNDQGIDAAGVVTAHGNLYGSSKDVGLIAQRLPLLGEQGGRVNRVSFSRRMIEGTFVRLGMFTEYTQESLDHDSDPELKQHMYRELLKGATEITDDMLQSDLLNNAGTVRYAGAALAKNQLGLEAFLTYQDLMRLSIDLDNNRTPKKTKVITGTKLTDTKTVDAGRVLYVGSEAIPMLEAMVDLHDAPAFTPVRQYAAGTQTFAGERGAIGEFRIVVAQEMQRFAGQGAAVPSSGADAEKAASYYTTGGKFDVFPALCVGDESFTTIGFQTNGKTHKFITRDQPPSANLDRQDPYGEVGFISIKWNYGFMAIRPERIAVLLFTAKM